MRGMHFGLLVCAVLMIPGLAFAQDEEAASAGWDEQAPCTKFQAEMEAIAGESGSLDAAMPKVDSRDALLAGIFQGTQIMLNYGERMFEASDEYEDKCKAALREANSEADIIRIYELVLTPTIHGYGFLQRVRDAAKSLDDQQTVDDMNAAITAYRESALQLVGFCEQDMPDEAKAKCTEFGKQIEEGLKGQ